MNTSAASLAGITRGLRLISWLAGQSAHVWTDSRSGRMALRIARAVGMKAIAASPGPLMSRVHLGRPLLSWWVLPEGNLINTLNAQLEKVSDSPDVVPLMRRLAKPRQTHGRRPALVLLIDERETSRGIDGAAVRHTAADFKRMLDAAENAHPAAEFWLVRSSDNGSGAWFSSTVQALPPGIRLADDASAAAREVDHVYTLGASEGMFALLANVPLHVHGAPYYAGWGLTHDARSFTSRTARPTLSALFDVIFVQWARYIDPATHAIGTLATLLDSIDLQHEVRSRFADLGNVAAIRFQWWKRPFATPFITAGGGRLRWTNASDALEAHECGVFWGARSAEGMPANARHVRIEDGFFHSCGLGSDMIAPRSQVIDQRGLYFDASRPSDLSVLLNKTEFSEAELTRAASLRKLVKDHGVTKYNLGRRVPEWTAPAGKRVILV